MGAPSPAAYWRGWSEIRADLHVAARVVLVLVLAGVLAGLVWWWLAPRADFRVTAGGAVVIGNPSEELFVADDGVFVLVLAGFGLAAGIATWFLRRRRGVAMLLALSIGCAAMAVVAWQLGALLGRGPTDAQLRDTGVVVTTALQLRSLAALAVAPFFALFAYLAGTVYVSYDDLGRTEAGPGAGEGLRPAPAGEPPAGDGPALLDAPSTGRSPG